jgi:glycerol-3-phosphate acyltransferase PlsY
MYTIIPGYTDAIWPQALMLLLIMVRHIPNYKRLRAGSENKVKINRKNP